MYLTYNVDSEWELKDRVNEDDYVVGTIDRAAGADETITAQLLARCYQRAGHTCTLWAAGSYGGSSNRKPTPYFLPHRADMKYAVPARQMLICSHVNLDHRQIPRFRIAMLCSTPRCVNVHHMIPEAFRTKASLILEDTVELSEPVNEALRDDLQTAVAEIQERLEASPKPQHRSITDLITSADTRKKND